MILRHLAPTLHIPWTIPYQLDDPPIVPTTFGKMMELRCVVSVIRHGDRTPKQKMKLEVKHPMWFDLFKRMNGYEVGNVKLKKPKHLQEVLDIARFLIAEIEKGGSSNAVIEEKKSKLEQVRYILEMYGHFSGINRKVQLKYQTKSKSKASASSEEDGAKVQVGRSSDHASSDIGCSVSPGAQSAADPQVGRRAHPHGPGPGRGAGQGVQVHVPRGPR